MTLTGVVQGTQACAPLKPLHAHAFVGKDKKGLENGVRLLGVELVVRDFDHAGALSKNRVR